MVVANEYIRATTKLLTFVGDSKSILTFITITVGISVSFVDVHGFYFLSFWHVNITNIITFVWTGDFNYLIWHRPAS